MRVRAYILAGTILVALAAAPAHAQAGYDRQAYGQGGYAAPPGQQGYGQDRDDDSQDRGARPAAQDRGSGYGEADQAQPDLGRDLDLRPDQRPALQAYQAATTPTAAEQQRIQDDIRRLASLTTPQRLDFTSRQMAQDQSDFGRRAQAVRRFYAQLTPQQQRRFDQLTAPPQGGDEEGAQGGVAGPSDRGGYDGDGRSPR